MRIPLLLLVVASSVVPLVACGSGGSGGNGPGGSSSSSGGGGSGGGTGSSSGSGSGGSSTGSGGSSSGGSSGGSSSGGSPACHETGFTSTSTSFTLPAMTIPLTSVSGVNTGCAGSPSQEWTTIDLTGTGKLDLVLTETCTDTTVGTSHWLVYPNTGSGFSTTAKTFALPTLDLPLTSVSGVNTGCAGSPSQEWTSVDLTGDGKLDLVLTETCSDTTVGSTHWLVYANTGSGFAMAPTTFALPALTLPLTSVSGVNTACAGSPSQEWTTVDVNGDKKPDLVLTETCTDTTVGTSHWLVYANTGSGFSTSPATFTLPKLDLALTSMSGANTARPGSPSQEWATVDLLGSGKPALVVTETCTDATVGTTHWNVYANSGSGFAATPTTFALPTLDLPLTSVGGANTACSGSPSQEWTSLDLNGDHRPDLVLTETCSDPSVGATHWNVYANTGSGFSTSPASFALPTLDEPLISLSGVNTACAGSANEEWTTLDLVGDGKFDLVLTETCTDASIGTTKWSRYAGACAP